MLKCVLHKCLFHGNPGSRLNHGSLVSTPPVHTTPKRHLNRFSRFDTTDACNQQTDRQTHAHTDHLYARTHTTTATPVKLSLFHGTTCVIGYVKSKTSLNLNDARDDGVWGMAVACKQSALRSTQITTPTPRHSFFTGRMLLLMPSLQCQNTEGRPPIHVYM